MKHIVQFLVLTTLLFVTSVSSAADLDTSIQEIGKSLAVQMKERQAKKLAVVSFSDLNGYQSALGDFIAEELITTLFNEGDFDIVERRELERVLSEQGSYTTGNFDRDTVAELEKLLGIDVLITGTITDLGDKIKINSRAISVETAKIFAAKGVTVDRDTTIDNLMSQSSSGSASTNTSSQEGVIKQPSNVYFQNKWLHVIPIGVVKEESDKSIQITTQFKNLTKNTLYLAQLTPSRRGDSKLAVFTELGDTFNTKISGISALSVFDRNRTSKQNNYTPIAPNSHINIIWNLSSSKPIKGSNLTMRSAFAVYTSNGFEETSVQLADIKLQ